MAKDDVIAIPPMEENEVLLSYLSPVWQLSDKVNVALLGEMDKFVPISPERIKALDFHEPGVAHLRVEVILSSYLVRTLQHLRKKNDHEKKFPHCSSKLKIQAPSFISTFCL